MKNSPKTYPRDVLMNILVIIALYVSAFAFLRLIFEYINDFLPDPLNPYYSAADSIRWALSLMVIIFPAYVFVSLFMHRDIKANPEKNDLLIRRWLIYITIFAAGVLIVGDLVALIYNFLQGELTWRFILKVLAILLLAVAVFGYYFYILRKKPEEFSRGAKIFSLLAIGIVLVAIIYGFIMAGSPFRQRMARFDERKISDLQILQNQIVNYWMQKEKLPGSLGDLTDSISGFVPPDDPQTKEAYSYKVGGKLSFELCAKFNLDSENYQQSGIQQAVPSVTSGAVKTAGNPDENWAHKSGENCFKKTIDPDLYKPAKKD